MVTEAHPPHGAGLLTNRGAPGAEVDRDLFVAQLQDIVGERNVVFHPEDLLVFEYDASIDRELPEAVVLPANTEEVSQVMSLAYREEIPVAGRGSGTGLSGGAIAAPGGIQVSFTCMNRILEVVQMRLYLQWEDRQ